MRLSELLSELKRRRVYRVAAAYVVASFTVLEAAELLLPALPSAAGIYRVLVILVLAGFPVALVLSWLFDITPEGVRRDAGDTDPDGEGAAAGWSGRPLLIATVVVGVVGVGAWLAGRRSARPPAPAVSGSLAVLPFGSAVPDSGLRRMGRELAITLGSSLASAAEVSTVDPLSVLAQVPPDQGSLTLDQAARVATSLGASRLVHGALSTQGDGFRLDIGLYETRGVRRLGTQRVTAAGLESLTDSATLALLRLVWTDDATAPPSPSAISTGSPEALRAYLEGEQDIAENRWREAPAAFQKAIAADSTFWFAYWRLQYAQEYHGVAVDSTVSARAWEHRATFPERDRLLIEARRATLSRALEILQDVTTRFPSYWPGWWDLAEVLVHDGGYLGHTLDESRTVLRRTLSLNPTFVPAWSHLFWIESQSRDADAMSDILDELSDARYGDVSLQEAGINSLTYYQVQHTLVEAGDSVPPGVIETGVRELSGYLGTTAPERITSNLMRDGFPRAQAALSRGLLAAPSISPRMETAQYFVLSQALAALGSWDAALAAADTYGSAATRPQQALFPYQIAVVGACLGEVSADEAARRRPRPGAELADRPELANELAWLDGVLALVRQDRVGLQAARRALSGDDGSGAPWLDRSLAAMERALEGDPGGAGHDLADLELELADHGHPGQLGPVHPFLQGVHRVMAARWLLQAGDTLTARRLLPWYEAVLPGALYGPALANQVLAGRAMALRAQLARAAGREDEAGALEEVRRTRDR